jgi:hypothetical protein
MRKSLLLAIPLLAAVVVAQNTDKIAPQANDRSISLHASNATVHGSTIRYEPQPHKNTIGYWTKQQDWVSWDFRLNRPGTFLVELTQSCGKGSGGSKYELSVGEQKLADVVPETGSFTNWTNRVIGKIELVQTGQQTLAVKPIHKPGLAVMDLRAVVLRPADGASSR